MQLIFANLRGVNFLYSALDAPWKAEQKVFVDNWAAQDDRFYPGLGLSLSSEKSPFHP